MRPILARFFERFLVDLGLKQVSPRVFELDGELSRSVKELALRQGCSPGEMASRLVSEALDCRRAAEASLVIWKDLPPREQEVAALACLGYTNAEIARMLMIANETVKSHVQNLLRKFGLRRKEELRRALAGWDFRAWDRREEEGRGVSGN